MPTVRWYVTTLILVALGLSLFGRRDLAVVLVIAAISARVAAVMAEFDVSREREKARR